MPPVLSLHADELRRFSVPFSLRLVGERQYAVGAGSLVIATDVRLVVEADETPDPFALNYIRQPAPSELAARWESALAAEVLGDAEALEGLALTVDFGDLLDIVPAEVLLTSPALAAGLTVAALAHRSDGTSETHGKLAASASDALRAVTDAQDGARYYADAMMSIAGGAGYVEPGGERLNVQELLPLEAFTLVLAPGATDGDVGERDRRLREALASVDRSGADIMRSGDEGLGALFGLGNVIDEEQTTMLYGMLRVRHMVEEFLEHLGEPYVDNDRLAEICDEESAILADYFSFPLGPYRSICAGAAEAGALGCKLTWAFGGLPAAVVIAPGRRREVNTALRRRFPDAHFLPVNMQVEGLMRAEEEAAEG